MRAASVSPSKRVPSLFKVWRHGRGVREVAMAGTGGDSRLAWPGDHQVSPPQQPSAPLYSGLCVRRLKVGKVEGRGDVAVLWLS